MPKPIDLSIIIVSWNVQDLLEKCLLSVFANQNNLSLEVFVVDNNSSDNTAEMIKEKFSEVKLIANQDNYGFARANNQAIKEAKGTFVLLLNPDTEIIHDTLKKMVEYMREHQEVGVAGCKILYPDKKIQLSVRQFPRVYDMIILMLKLHNLFPELVSEYYCLDFDYYQEQGVDQVMGAFFMIRKKVIDQIGLLDENYFIWMEEVDYCQRVKKAGWSIFYTPMAEIIHYGARSFKQVLTLRRQKLLNVSIIYYFKKHHSYFSYLILYCFLPISYLLSLLITIIYGAKNGRSVS